MNSVSFIWASQMCRFIPCSIWILYPETRNEFTFFCQVRAQNETSRENRKDLARIQALQIVLKSHGWRDGIWWELILQGRKDDATPFFFSFSWCLLRVNKWNSFGAIRDCKLPWGWSRLLTSMHPQFYLFPFYFQSVLTVTFFTELNPNPRFETAMANFVNKLKIKVYFN